MIWATIITEGMSNKVNKQRTGALILMNAEFFLQISKPSNYNIASSI